MKNTFFFLLNFLKKPLIWITVIVVALVSFFSFATTDLRKDLPCAVFSEDSSEEAQEIVTYLQGKGYTVCSSEAEVRSMLEEGTADCGVVIQEGLKDKLSDYDLTKCAEFIVSDRTQNAAMYRLMTAVAIYRLFMPYKAAEASWQYGYDASPEDIEQYLEQVEDKVNPLEFELVTVDGEVVDTEENNDLPVGVAAISIFAILGFICTGLLRRTSRSVRIRFSSGTEFFFKCVLPQCMAMGILVFVSAAAGFAVAAVFFAVPLAELIIASAIYIILLNLLFAVLSMLPVSDYVLLCLIALDAALSLVLCPLYEGTTLLLSYIGPLRVISAPYLLFFFFGIL